MAGVGLSGVETDFQPSDRPEIAGLPVPVQKQFLDAEENRTEKMPVELDGYVDHLWREAVDAKRIIRKRLQSCLEQRKGDYSPEKLREIEKTGGSKIFSRITGVKCRSASAWIREVLLAESGDDRPFSVKPTPIPELPKIVTQEIRRMAIEKLQQDIIRATQPPQVPGAGMGAPGAPAGGMEQAPAPAPEQPQMPPTGAPQPSPVPQLSPESLKNMVENMTAKVKEKMMLDAGMRAENMETLIYDQMVEGKFFVAMRDFIDDLVTYPTAFLEGPIIRRRKKLSWEVSDMDDWRPKLDDKIVLEWERISPFDVYPSPHSMGSIHDSHLFIRSRYSADVIQSFKGVDGFNDEAIDKALKAYGEQGHEQHAEYTNDQQRDRLEDRYNTGIRKETGKIEVRRFWGDVMGSVLLSWDTELNVEENMSYAVECWSINGIVIKCVRNRMPMGQSPIHGSSFEKLPGSIWGTSLTEMMQDDQQMCNALSRAISNNVGIASGPQVTINDVSRLPVGHDIESLYPWKIWEFIEDGNNTSFKPPLSFYQPDLMADRLMNVFEFYFQKAGEYTNIPDYIYGGGASSGKGALSTATGLSIATGNASKTIKQTIANVDMDVISPTVYQTYLHNMEYAEDNSIKGDCQVVPRGAASLVVREQLMLRRKEFLDSTNNELDLRLMGQEGRRTILRELAKSLDMPVDEVVPPIPVGQDDFTPEQARALIDEMKNRIQVMQSELEAAQKIANERYEDFKARAQTEIEKEMIRARKEIEVAKIKDAEKAASREDAMTVAKSQAFRDHKKMAMVKKRDDAQNFGGGGFAGING